MYQADLHLVTVSLFYDNKLGKSKSNCTYTSSIAVSQRLALSLNDGKEIRPYLFWRLGRIKS